MTTPRSWPAKKLQWKPFLWLLILCLLIAIPTVGAVTLRLRDNRQAQAVIKQERVGLGCTLAAARLLTAVERLRLALDTSTAAPQTLRAAAGLRSATAELGRLPCVTLSLGPRIPLRVWMQRSERVLREPNADAAARASLALGTDALGMLTDIGDASGLTYDPTVDAVNLDDAIIARIPGFIERLDQSAAVLALSHRHAHVSRPNVVAIEKLSGQALVMEAMADDDFDGAALALPSLGPALHAAREGTQVAGAALGRAIDAGVMLRRGAPADRRLPRLRSASIDAGGRLMRDSVHVLEASFDRRIAALQSDERTTLAAGGTALYAGCIIILTLWHTMRRRDRAELERTRERALLLENELARANAERALNMTQQQFRAVFDGSDVGIAIVDATGDRLEANSALKRMFRSDLSAVTHEIRSLFERARSDGAHARHEASFERPDGTPLWVELSLSLVRDGPNEPASCIVLVHDITNHKMLSARLDHETTHDALTGLPNRLFLMRRIAELLARRTDAFALAFIDLDHFKEVNDTLGHHAGDDALRTAAQRLSAAVRPIDTVARLHGDEFAVLFEHIGSDEREEAVDAVVARIGSALVFAVESATRTIQLTASIGFVRDGLRYPDATALLNDADSAMYRSKVAGRNMATAFEDVNASL